MEGVCGKFLKTVFIFLNFLFLVLGLTALGFGLWGVISGEKVFEKDWFPTLSDKTLQDSKLVFSFLDWFGFLLSPIKLYKTVIWFLLDWLIDWLIWFVKWHDWFPTLSDKTLQDNKLDFSSPDWFGFLLSMIKLSKTVSWLLHGCRGALKFPTST